MQKVHFRLTCVRPLPVDVRWSKTSLPLRNKSRDPRLTKYQVLIRFDAPFTGQPDKVIYSRRRPRRTSGTLQLPRQSVQEEIEEGEEVQQQANALSHDLSRANQVTAENQSKKFSCNANPSPERPNSDRESVAMVQPFCRAHSPIGNNLKEKDVQNTVKAQPDPFDSLERLQKENIRAKWFLQDPNSQVPTEKATPIIVNGDINSFNSSQRPLLGQNPGSTEELDSNQLYPISPLKKRKSFSDSLLCTVPQDEDQRQRDELVNGLPSDHSIDRGGGSVKLNSKETNSPNSKQKGSPLSNKKVLNTNGPCSKHSDEETISSRNRTTTHPCYDPMDFSKRRRNAACTVGILPPSERGSESDFLETNI